MISDLKKYYFISSNKPITKPDAKLFQPVKFTDPYQIRDWWKTNNNKELVFHPWTIFFILTGKMFADITDAKYETRGKWVYKIKIKFMMKTANKDEVGMLNVI